MDDHKELHIYRHHFALCYLRLSNTAQDIVSGVDKINEDNSKKPGMDRGMWDDLPPHMRERLMHRMALMGDMDPREMFGGLEHEFDHHSEMNDDDSSDVDEDTNMLNEENVDTDDNEQQVEFTQDFDDEPSYHNEEKDPVDLGTRTCVAVVCLVL